jgi:hypothetical protein
MFVEYMILQACKITDSAQDFRKNDNHTMAFPFYINGVARLSDADGLLKALKHGACFDQLLDDSDPALTRRCTDLALRAFLD